ncbi:MAG: hypothetical protein K9J37_02500 [Saprospiraceae bacterium]|nr:hypothetical protein [Saprospiraceae bacterium]MCF8248750.1 hypothetical protein [Saprospiraceae bacterium]MCF8278760.1 hypothetical protein [Bacteroidales bacterium]MCF8310560.1 hypothetical protein [Saprospiraceae bacterium]MCF8439119.1 hypothetical protein [Saprospiraceae bacterium]
MALTDFFRINFPYGIKRNKSDQWVAFNREYMPLGWNSQFVRNSIVDEHAFDDLPIFTAYKGMTDKQLMKIVDSPQAVQYDESGKIKTIFLYNDGTNPQTFPEYWNDYLKKIKLLSTFERVGQHF